jgi:glutamyl-tRNA synthetase
MSFLSKLFTPHPKVITRFAPSPTGLLHAGNYRTAVFAYIYAKQNKGTCILRIEDTDRERSKKEYEQNIFESLAWLGLSFDETYRQSERGDLYKQYLEKLVSGGHAYVSKEQASDDTQGATDQKERRAEVIRFKNPNKKVLFHDLIRGDIEFDTTDLGDFIIAKSFNEPVFHFAVVLDDFLSKVTHVIRGEDHISNTPRQILIQQALGAPQPTYAHLPLVLAGDRSKLSKRRGALAMTEYRDRGYLPQTLLNYMALLGWNPGTEKELFTLPELISEFNLAKVQKGGAIFDEKKLRWLNKEHLKVMNLEDRIKNLEEKLKKAGGFEAINREMLTKIVPVVFERLETLADIDTLIKEGDFGYYIKAPEFDIEKLLWKEEKDFSLTQKHLTEVQKLLANGSFSSEDEVKKAVWAYAEASGRGNVLWPLRVALSGKEKSPNPFALAYILGKEETLKRINHAITRIDLQKNK